MNTGDSFFHFKLSMCLDLVLPNRKDRLALSMILFISSDEAFVVSLVIHNKTIFSWDVEFFEKY